MSSKAKKGYWERCCGTRGCVNRVEPYMIKDHLWNQIRRRNQFVCLSCVEKRLGRKLTIADFTDAPINFGIFGFDCYDYVDRNQREKQYGSKTSGTVGNQAGAHPTA